MYKQRINDWDLHKNLKKAEKATLVRRWRQTGGADPLIFNGRPVEMHKLVRFCKDNHVPAGDQEISAPRKRQRRLECPVDTKIFVESVPHNLQSLLRPPAEPIKPIALDGSIRNAELIIWNTQNYLSAYFTTGPGNRYFNVDSSVQPPVRVKNKAAWEDVGGSFSMYDLVFDAFLALEQGFVDSAFEAMGKASTLLKVILEQQEPSFLAFLFATLLECTNRRSKLARKMQDFILEMVRVVLGDAHPITMIAQKFCMLSSAAEKGFVWGAATVALHKSFGALEDSKPLKDTRRTYFNGLQQTYLDVLFFNDEEGKEKNPNYIYKMGRLLYSLHKYVEAEIQFRKCLELLKDSEHEILAGTTNSSFLRWQDEITGCRYVLPIISERAERIDEAKAMWWRAVEFVSAAFGHDDIVTQAYGSRFDDFLELHGYEEQRAALRAQYPWLLLRQKLPPDSL
jgi:tetratricopeptide (TPR) repeat protein